MLGKSGKGSSAGVGTFTIKFVAEAIVQITCLIIRKKSYV
jgi:hypothetical protein